MNVNEKWFLLQAMRGQALDSILPPLAEPALDSIPKSPDQWIALANQHYPALKKLASQSRQYAFESRASSSDAVGRWLNFRHRMRFARQNRRHDRHAAGTICNGFQGRNQSSAVLRKQQGKIGEVDAAMQRSVDFRIVPTGRISKRGSALCMRYQCTRCRASTVP